MTEEEQEEGFGSPPALAAMPHLRKAERDALVASITRFGVVVPVVVDGHGEVIDGNNRTAIAAQLGVDCPRQVRPCTPEERDALRVELNAARRQLPPEKWRPMVDHLRGLGHSDRAIATAVGVGKDTVNRYVSPEPSTVSGETLEAEHGRVGEDGKRRAAPGQPTQRERILGALRRNHPRFYTALELAALDDIPHDNVRSVLSDLHGKGLVRREGPRPYRYQAVPEDEVRPPAEPKSKVARVLEQAAEVAGELKDFTATSKAQRRGLAALRALQEEEDRQRAAAEREERRLLDAQVDQAFSRGEHWYGLRLKLDGVAVDVAHHCRDFDGLPVPTVEGLILLDRAMANLREYLDVLEAKLHPGRSNGLRRGTVIDASAR